jgi:electron transfer flavoprotein alpha subunit
MENDIFVLIEHLRGQVADISYVMLTAARELAEGTGGRVVAVLLGHGAEGLAGDLAADSVLYADHDSLKEFTSDAYLQVLESILQDQSPRAMLFGDTSIGSDVAGGLSVKLGITLISGCRTFTIQDGKVKFISQIYGGKIMAEGELPGPSALVTMIPGGYKPDSGKSASTPDMTTIEVPDLSGLRVSLKQYVEPEITDVDISKEPILIAIGRGIQREDNLELAEELAGAMGGVLCASRPVVDQGWLSTARMVGKSGKTVKPSIYLAMGISGAPEHVEGMSDSELIIAINTDPAAPIFDVAQFGAEADLLDLLPVLTERVEEAKGG